MALWEPTGRMYWEHVGPRDASDICDHIMCELGKDTGSIHADQNPGSAPVWNTCLLTKS